jgi:hypothetical protein
VDDFLLFGGSVAQDHSEIARKCVKSIQMSLRLDATSSPEVSISGCRFKIGATTEQLPQRCGHFLDQETAGFVGTNLRIRSAFPCVIFSKSP